MHLKHIYGLSLATYSLLWPFFLSGFTDQRREQLHQRRSGGVEMQRWVAVGKHLALRLQEAGGVGIRWSTDVPKTACVDGEGAESQT